MMARGSGVFQVPSHPAYIEVVAEDGGYSLRRHNADGTCIADTWHVSIKEAREQAESEYVIGDDDWIRHESAAPADRERFNGDWDQCVHLLEQLAYWYWDADDDDRARNMAGRLEAVLARIDDQAETLRGAEAWALVAAVDEDWSRCLAAKRRQIDVLRILLADGVDPEVAESYDLLVAMEELLMFAQMAGVPAAGDEVLADVLMDPNVLDAERTLIAGLKARLGFGTPS